MILLETLGIPGAFLIGTIGMLCLAIALIVFIIFHQRNVIRYQLKMQQMDAEQQKVLLQASIKFQEEERQKIAADLHDDAGPLLATARLYLTENLVNQNKHVLNKNPVQAKLNYQIKMKPSLTAQTQRKMPKIPILPPGLWEDR